MDWTSDTAGELYSATQGSCQGLVWHNPMGGWKALVSRKGVAVQANQFATLEEAWAWCEPHLAALVTAEERRDD